VVLGVLSVVGGLLNVPALFGGGAWLHHWLEPVTEASTHIVHPVELSHATEWVLVGIAVAIGVTGIVAAWRLLDPAKLVPARSAPVETGLQRILLKKWYVDELYDAAIVRPLLWLSRRVLWQGVDQGVVDGTGVNGAARASRALGWLGSKLQTGEVGLYVTVFVAGVVGVLLLASGGGR
jgi:NADH-quinone oxidoreductase subunit L